MEYLNINKVKLKNALSIIENPIIEDLLYEIVLFLSVEQRSDGIFTIREVTLKTRVRIYDEFQDHIKELIDKGYIEKVKSTMYKVLNHPW